MVRNPAEIVKGVLIYCPRLYNHGQKLDQQLRKTVLSLTQQAMYNQLKRPSARSISELYYIYGKTSDFRLKTLRKYLPRKKLLCISKDFVRPHLDYGDIIFDHPFNLSFENKLESIQYKATLAITGCFGGTSRDKLYQELCLESLSDRRLTRRLYFL